MSTQTTTFPAYAATLTDNDAARFGAVLDELEAASREARRSAADLVEIAQNGLHRLADGLFVYQHRSAAATAAEYATAVEKRDALTRVARVLFGNEDPFVTQAARGESGTHFKYRGAIAAR